MSKKLSAVSLFSGSGGFDWGAHKAGVDIVWANDNDPFAANAYRSIFPDTEFILDDIRNIKSFPKADILIGCYPCTGFSVAARRRGFNMIERDLKSNKNNFLYTEYLRALKQIKPKYLFVENVKGMVSADDGWFLQEQIKGFEAAGYKVHYEPLQATHFGVPQSRTRIFIVGVHKDETSFEYEFPKPSYGPGLRYDYKVLKDAILDMEEWPIGEFLDYSFHGHYLTRNRKRKWDEPSYTIVAHAHHVPLHPMGRPMKYIGKDQWALQGTKNRRLSWRECAAIQGLPARVNPGGKLIDKYRVIGNAVPPRFGEALLKPIVKFEN
jgi:DNA (cytosine-5)-methyltransferase 1